jgi:hypothetical protein
VVTFLYVTNKLFIMMVITTIFFIHTVRCINYVTRKMYVFIENNTIILFEKLPYYDLKNIGLNIYKYRTYNRNLRVHCTEQGTEMSVIGACALAQPSPASNSSSQLCDLPVCRVKSTRRTAA